MEQRPLITRFKVKADENGIEHIEITNRVYPRKPTFDEIYVKALKRDKSIKIIISSIICLVIMLLYFCSC